jgi:hypothetical protein
MTDLAESVLQVMDGDDQLAVLLGVLERVSEPVGRPGRLSQRMTAGVWAKSWSISVDSVNDMIHASCARPARCNGSSVPWRTATSARRPPLTSGARLLKLKKTLNAMVDQLNSCALEVTRVARDVGPERKLGQAAAVAIVVARQ